MTGFCEDGTGPLDSVKDGEFLKQLNDYKLHNEDSASLSYFVVCI
jgi:hypothetical protein